MIDGLYSNLEEDQGLRSPVSGREPDTGAWDILAAPPRLVELQV